MDLNLMVLLRNGMGEGEVARGGGISAGSCLQGPGPLSCRKKVYHAFGFSRTIPADFICSNDPESHRAPRAVPVCVRGHPSPDDAPDEEPRKPGGNANVSVPRT